MSLRAARTVLLLVGPEAVGKSWVAAVAEQRLGVRHVDADRLVLDRIAAGEHPDPVDGWLAPVQQAVLQVLGPHRTVSVEATGAWDSDWRLAQELATEHVRVVRVLVWTTRERRRGRAPTAACGVTSRDAGSDLTVALSLPAPPGRRAAGDCLDRRRSGGHSSRSSTARSATVQAVLLSR